MTGILFTARLGSSRLPKKHLVEASSKTFIEWLILRYQRMFEREISKGSVKLILVTSDEPLNKAFEKVLRPYNVDVFFGSISNIPIRHLSCANRYDLKNIISIDGDDILCSPTASRLVYEKLNTGIGNDIVSSIGLPLGMNSSGYTTSYLRKCMQEITTDEKIETGWGRIFINPQKCEIKTGDHDIYDKLRFTLDYPEDAKFFQTVINFLGDKLYDISDENLIKIVKEQEFDKINSHLFEIYWNNYNSLKEQESQNGK